MRWRTSGSANLNDEQSADGAIVALTTLDNFCENNDIKRLDFMKIDVEGHEEKVLQGGKRVIRENRPLLLIELDPARLKEGASSVEKIIESLTEMGDVFYQANRSSLVPLFLPMKSSLLNVFCFHIEAH